jgi:DivIVA domain-containing protein
MIPPQELGKKSFNRSVRGYEPSEVDDYVEFLIEKYTDIYKQCEIYDKKLRLVREKIAEIQEREDEIQTKEETISKTMMSSQVMIDKTIEEAQGMADNIMLKAEQAAEKILADARERAQRALAAVNKKTEEQIESAREKSENLYLAARTRCAKLLGDFKKEIGNQKERMSTLKEAADNFSLELSEAYRNQFEAIKSVAIYAPAIDFDRLTETRLFNIIMEEIKEDMAEIEAKKGESEYEFEKELMLLQDFDFAEEHIKEYKSGVSDYQFKEEDKISEEAPADSESAYSAEDTQEDDDDVKVFAGSVPADEPETGAAEVAEEPIATYDSDDYQETNYSYEPDYSEESADESSHENDEGNSGGFFGLFKGFGKKKKPEKSKWSGDADDDIDNIYTDLDDDEDDEKEREILDMFDGLGDEEED